MVKIIYIHVRAYVFSMTNKIYAFFKNYSISMLAFLTMYIYFCYFRIDMKLSDFIEKLILFQLSISELYNSSLMLLFKNIFG